MANSYRKRILNYLRDVTLKAVDSHQGYNSTLKLIERGLKEKDALNDNDFPAIFISRANEERENITRNQFKSSMRVILIGYVKNETGVNGIQEDMDDFIEDITEAVEEDRTLGGISKWLEIKSIATDDGDLSPFGVCVIIVEVVYATEGINS
jgi:hypothetical protein